MLLKFLLALPAVLCLAALGAFAFLHTERFGSLPEGEALEACRRSPRWHGEGFANPIPTPRLAEGAGFFSTMLEFLVKRPEDPAPQAPLPTVKTDLRNLDPAQDVVIWLGHSSYFIQLGGHRLLVDPVLSGSAAPVSFSTRAFPGSDIYAAEDIPDVDVLLISHDHWDHLDHRTLKALKPRIRNVLCGLGTGAHLRRWGFEASRIHEGDWGDAFSFGPGGRLSIRLAEARHYSGRSFTTHKALWVGFIIEVARGEAPARSIFFSGDSGYGPHFARIGEEHGPFDLALLECGQYDRRWPYIHMKPEETAQAAEDLRARVLFPGHNGKFCIAYHSWREPGERILEASQGRPYRLAAPLIGEPLAPWDGLVPASKWWDS